MSDEDTQYSMDKLSGAINRALDLIDSDKFYDAISVGVQGAIWQMITNATDAPTADFFETVKEGVKEAMMEIKQG